MLHFAAANVRVAVYIFTLLTPKAITYIVQSYRPETIISRKKLPKEREGGTVKKKKVKTSIYIARFMHQAPLTRTSLKLGRQTAI